MASIPVIKAHASRGFPLDADRRSGQAGTGGARNRTIRLDSGDTAWMLTATALVLMMTIPGVMLFYGGVVILIQRKGSGVQRHYSKQCDGTSVTSDE